MLHFRGLGCSIFVTERNDMALHRKSLTFLQKDDYTKLICDDGIHPNKAGHRVIAEKILHYIESNYMFLLNTHPQTTGL